MNMLYMRLLERKSNGEIYVSRAMFSHLLMPFRSPSMSGLRKQWCPEIVDLVERMWAQEHQDRPTMSQVVEELKKYHAMY